MSESTNSEAVFGSDIKRLPFKDLIKRIGPGLIAWCGYNFSNVGSELWLCLDLVDFPHHFYGYHIYDGHESFGNHHWAAYYSRYSQVLWTCSISGCWYRCLYGMSLFYHGQYFRYRRGHEPDLWDQLENRLFDYDCHCPLLLLCQECLF